MTKQETREVLALRLENLSLHHRLVSKEMEELNKQIAEEEAQEAQEEEAAK